MFDIQLKLDLTKPVTDLLEKCSGATGLTILQSTGNAIAKIITTKGNTIADAIKTKGDLKISERQHRYHQRLKHEELQKQANMENILLLALPSILDNAKPQNIENDWIVKFFEECRIISDKDMQTLWAKILAGEANVPGTFSKRTLQFVSLLEKKDAHLFTQLCAYNWVMKDELITIISEFNHPLYMQNGINFETLAHLEDIGLIKLNNLGFCKNELPKVNEIRYFEKSTIIEFARKPYTLKIGVVFLTNIAKELATICGARPSEEYYKHMIHEWSQEGIIKPPTVIQT